MPVKLILIIVIGLVIIGVCLFLGYKLIFNKKEELTKEEKTKITAQDFTNVKDIKDSILYTNDDNAFVYLEIQPLSLEMLSFEEQKIFTKNLTSALSSERQPFKMISFPKPMDLSYLIYKYEQMYKVASTEIEKKLIGEEIRRMKQITIDNSANEFKFYFIFWDKKENANELLKRARDFKNNFEDSSLKVDLISEKEIYRLCNMMNNPNYSNFDNDDFERNITVIKDYN